MQYFARNIKTIKKLFSKWVMIKKQKELVEISDVE
jgi:hypothetical protein